MNGQTIKQHGREQFRKACAEYYAALNAPSPDPRRFVIASLTVHREAGNPGVTAAMRAVPKRYFRQHCNKT